MESDANAAAYGFIVARYGRQAVERAAADAPTDPTLRPGSTTVRTDELRGRMIDWFAANLELCRRYGRDGAPDFPDADPDILFAQTLSLCSTGAGGIWRERVAATR